VKMMNILKGWPFEPIEIPNEELSGDKRSG
jgi:hypothetical protein